MWRSSLLALLLLGASAPTARSEICLPGVFEGGTRLTEMEPRVFWLEPLLRQHEVCWRRPGSPGERRVFVFGSSSIFGYPHPSERSAIGIVNRRFAEEEVPAHLFNLAFIWTYHLKDALLVREASRFEPDVILYSVTLDDFFHAVPHGLRPLNAFFLQNSAKAERFAAEAPPALAEPFERYRALWADDRWLDPTWRNLRQAGLFVRIGVAELGRQVRRRWFPGLPDERVALTKRQARYDCGKVIERFETFWKGWQEWSLFPYLEGLRAGTGAEILVVNWPVAHEPVRRCYNARYGKRAFAGYNRWLAEEAAARGFRYLDLHDLLPAAEFLDSIHPSVTGQRQIAGRLETELRDLLAREGRP